MAWLSFWNERSTYEQSTTGSTSKHKRSNNSKNPSKQKNATTRRKLSSTQNNKLVNLVIPIQFANHASRPSISKANLSALFNSLEPIEGLTPTGSIRQYFAVNSYGKLSVESTVADWIRVKNTEQYYAGKQSGLSATFHESLIEALNKLDSDPDFSFSDYDRDGDGVVDSIFFLHSGYSAEYGGVDCINGNDRSNRIWSHKWKIGSDGWVSKSSGVKVDDYAVSSAIYGVCSKEIARIGTIAHEMGRLFGESGSFFSPLLVSECIVV
jgi:M6 family metalloprotease-like protein